MMRLSSFRYTRRHKATSVSVAVCSHVPLLIRSHISAASFDSTSSSFDSGGVPHFPPTSIIAALVLATTGIYTFASYKQSAASAYLNPQNHLFKAAVPLRPSYFPWHRILCACEPTDTSATFSSLPRHRQYPSTAAVPDCDEDAGNDSEIDAGSRSLRSYVHASVRSVRGRIQKFARDAPPIAQRAVEVCVRFTPLAVLIPLTFVEKGLMSLSIPPPEEKDIGDHVGTCSNGGFLEEATWSYALSMIEDLGPAFVKLAQVCDNMIF
mmetsp:Transcript_24359/g.55617  ORF Transcript_24359/g.55617 Transcript_24359/m.55617 type:complete len:266 (+) Transcript_24359:172-969(+)